MSLDARTRDELLKSIAEQLNYFEWIDQNQGAYASVTEWENLRSQSGIRFNRDPVFHLKVRCMLDSIEFVMTDPATVDKRTKERLKQLEFHAEWLSRNLGISKSVALHDLLTVDYR